MLLQWCYSATIVSIVSYFSDSHLRHPSATLRHWPRLYPPLCTVCCAETALHPPRYIHPPNSAISYLSNDALAGIAARVRLWMVDVVEHVARCQPPELGRLPPSSPVLGPCRPAAPSRPCRPAALLRALRPAGLSRPCHPAALSRALPPSSPV